MSAGDLIDISVTWEYHREVELRSDHDMKAPCLPVGLHADGGSRVFIFGGLRDQRGVPIKTIPVCVELCGDGSLVENVYTRHFAILLNRNFRTRNPEVLREPMRRYCLRAHQQQAMA